MSRSSIYLLIVFIVLGVSVLIIERPFSEPVKVVNPDLGPMFKAFDRLSVTEMEFGSFGGSTVLKKDSDDWLVLDKDKTFPADSDAIEKVFETIEGMIAKELISTNPTKHISFQVNAPQETETTDADGNKQPFRMGTLGTEVILRQADGTEAVHLFVGKNGAANFMTTYVRKQGSDSVVIVDGYLKAIFGKSGAAGWKDLTICNIEEKNLKTIRIGTGNDQIELTATGIVETEEPAEPAGEPSETEKTIVWTMTKPKEMDIDQAEIGKLTRLFNNFRATDYSEPIDDPSAYQFDNPNAVVTLQLMDSSELTLTIGAESSDRPNNYFLKISNSPSIFLVPKYRLEYFQKKAADFEPKSDGAGA